MTALVTPTVGVGRSDCTSPKKISVLSWSPCTHMYVYTCSYMCLDTERRKREEMEGEGTREEGEGEVNRDRDR